MKNRKSTPCIICKKQVEQDLSTSSDRQTCKRKEVNGGRVKSECEKEKDRRYQKAYRDNNAGGMTPRAPKCRSVAVSSIKHLTKYKAKKYKRFCLKCETPFTGIGAYHRICDSCTVENTRVKPLRGV